MRGLLLAKIERREWLLLKKRCVMALSNRSDLAVDPDVYASTARVIGWWRSKR
jgi:hypothetical protein